MDLMLHIPIGFSVYTNNSFVMTPKSFVLVSPVFIWGLLICLKSTTHHQRLFPTGGTGSVANIKLG